MTVNLTRIYTRLGDDGETHLGDMSRVPKTHPRIEAYGTVDELNAQLGVALALRGSLGERFAGFLRRVQNDLFDVGADISVPHGGDRERLRLAPEQTAWLEQACDEVNAELEPLKSFVLPGGSAAAAQLHVCRTVCRRAERRTIDCGDDGQPRVRALPQPPLRPALHPRARGERRRRAAVGARAATAERDGDHRPRPVPRRAPRPARALRHRAPALRALGAAGRADRRAAGDGAAARRGRLPRAARRARRAGRRSTGCTASRPPRASAAASPGCATTRATCCSSATRRCASRCSTSST